eukprot:CAMPEP_0182491476 /NCGR_PEP_ID=MMETSP1321-20130603/902_1 /TAXON_ID=91990 /ORGANISM="Bolidomonas sp., Strain RCC1657" /LENGTH=362 /DNA_ID=CAMNT_0024693757 /DNA_START=176 /DNA_END=1264 /DNA_ORIENTATION=-
MTTGQRWAKIASSGDDELITTQEQVEAMRSGNYGGGGGGGEPGTSSSLIVPEPKPPPTFDYDLMYRTYLRIPSSVRPPLPDRDALSDEDWEAAMKQIWEDRQKTLKEAMENIVDVPDVLQEMINKIANSSSPPTPTPTRVEDLLFELGELEYLLSDLDVARDFYILGGWPILINLLSHSDPSILDLALHCVGTAVKNAGEFEDWMLENDAMALRSVVALLDGGDGGSSVGNNNNNKLIYALGSMLRGNADVLNKFRELGGPEKLLKAGRTFEGKALTKACALAGDIELEGWCVPCSRVLLISQSMGDHETALKSLRSFKCRDVEGTKVRGALKGVQKKWGKMDKEWRQEVEALAQSVIESLK